LKGAVFSKSVFGNVAAGEIFIEGSETQNIQKRWLFKTPFWYDYPNEPFSACTTTNHLDHLVT
jgi:hypothetical protein